jgi:hypothetical protein
MEAIETKRTSALLSYFSLFGSVGTLLCCALPSLFVLAGLGATIASTLSAFPWLVTLSHHKYWTFGISGPLIAASFLNMYYIAPQFRSQSCPLEDPNACAIVSGFSKWILWISAMLYVGGFFVAFLLGPILARFDRL